MLDLIVNPVAGNGLALSASRQIARELELRGLPFQVHETAYPGHATLLAREAAQRGGCTALSIGGDGTAYETACGLVFTQTSLGVIPAGTGNDFVKAIGLPRKPLDALGYILEHPARPVDMGRLNGQFFLNVCGAGFDVMVLDCAKPAKKYFKGLLPYLYGLIRAIFHYQPIPVKLTLEDGSVIEKKVLIASVANGRYIGGGIPIAPCALVDDGLLDLVIVNDVPRWKIPRYLPGLLGGRILSFPITERYLVKKVTLESPGMRINIDGEILPMDRAEIAALPGALRVHW